MSFYSFRKFKVYPIHTCNQYKQVGRFIVSANSKFIQYILVNCSSQETEVTSTPTRPVDNVVLATKAYRTKTHI